MLSLRLIGSCVQLPELRQTFKGQPITSVELTVHQLWIEDIEQAHGEIVTMTIRGKCAEVAAQHMVAGIPVYIEARIVFDEDWQRLRIVGEHLRFGGNSDFLEFLDRSTRVG